MRTAGTATWLCALISATLALVGGWVALSKVRRDAVPAELRLSLPQPELPAGQRPRVPHQHEVSLELPRWFGDEDADPVRIAGTVIGARSTTKVRLAIDVPEPAIWSGREIPVGPDGAFDFGPMRVGKYLVVASGLQRDSRVTRIDTTRGPAEDIELFVYPCQVFHEELWLYDRPAAGMDVEIAGRVVGTADARGHVSTCVQEHRDLQIQGAGFWWSGSFPRPNLGVRIWRDRVLTGRVLNADGSPATHVGVQPLGYAPIDIVACHGDPIVTTTDHDGRFAVAGDSRVCGLRIFRGLDTYVLTSGKGQGDPLVLELQPRAGGGEEMIARLPPRGAVPGLRAPPVEPWIHGHVVAGGAPVVDARVALLVGYSDAHGPTAYTRRDGSFALFVDRAGIEREGWHIIDADQIHRGLAGRVTFGDDESRGDLTIEVGSGLVVHGTVVDTRGRPMVGVRLGFDDYTSLKSEPSGPDGSYALVLPRPGRYRLGVFDDRGRELSPPPGRLPPTVDVEHPNGERRGVRVTVLRDPPTEHLGFSRVHASRVDLGVMLDDHQRVVRIADEAAAAGMRIGDRVLCVGDDQHGGDSARFGTDFSVPPGSDVAWTAMRAGKVLWFRAHAPWLGAPASSE